MLCADGTEQFLQGYRRGTWNRTKGVHPGLGYVGGPAQSHDRSFLQGDQQLGEHLGPLFAGLAILVEAFCGGGSRGLALGLGSGGDPTGNRTKQLPGVVVIPGEQHGGTSRGQSISLIRTQGVIHGNDALRRRLRVG